MKDRISLYPNRVKLVPVEGQENTYDMVRADSPTDPGTPLSKANLLSDLVAEVFGLGSDAVPNDVLDLLSRFHRGLGDEHLWSVAPAVGRYQLRLEELDETYGEEHGSAFVSNNAIVQVADDVLVNGETGDVTLVSPQKVTISLSMDPSQLVGKYLKTVTTEAGLTEGWIYKCLACEPESVYTRLTAQHVTSVYVTAGDVYKYVNSPREDAYPPEEDDGNVYNYLGQLGGGVQIVTGSYVGTGTYGTNNRNSLTFSFVPKMVWLDILTVSGFNSVPQYYILFQGCTEGFSFGHNDHLTVAWSGRTVTWYFGKSDSSGAKYQFNTKGQTYHYMAIG